MRFSNLGPRNAALGNEVKSPFVSPTITFPLFTALVFSFQRLTSMEETMAYPGEFCHNDNTEQCYRNAHLAAKDTQLFYLFRAIGSTTRTIKENFALL